MPGEANVSLSHSAVLGFVDEGNMQIFELLNALSGVKKSGDGWMARCPAHEDVNPSLSIAVGDQGGILLHCFAGCTPDSVAGSLDLKMADLIGAGENGNVQPAKKTKTKKNYDSADAAIKALEFATGKRFVRSWSYPRDTFRVLRFEPKSFRPIHYIEGAWRIGDLPGKLPLYRCDQLLDGNRVFVCEGERDVDAAWSIGLQAVTSAHGAQAATKSDWAALADRDVVILPDHDDAGHKYAEIVAALLQKLEPPARVKIVELPGLAEGGDLTDWLNERDSLEIHDLQDELNRLADKSEIAAELGRSFPATDLGNAERFAARNKDHVRHCWPWGKWLIWNGRQWQHDAGDQIRALAKNTVREIYRDAADEPDERSRKEIAAYARKSESVSKIRAMLDLARSEAGIPVGPAEVDQHPWTLNCLNGEVDLRTGEITPHRRENLITQITPTIYDPAACAPAWENFLREIMDGDVQLVDYLRRAVGYACTGSTREHGLFFFYGAGRNGKSTFLNAIKSAVGRDYSAEAPPDLLIAKHGDGHPTERAALFGKRFVSTVEVQDGRRLAEVTVKQLTGGDPIAARRMREDFWEFLPTHTIFLAANHKPNVYGTDYAIWSRIKLIPFTVSFEGREDRQLPERLEAERTGILAWLVRGAVEWFANGLQDPQIVAEAVSSYRDEQDLLKNWIDETCIIGPDCRARAIDLYAKFKAFQEANGDPVISQTKFGRKLEDRGFQKSRENGTGRVIRIGIELRSMFD